MPTNNTYIPTEAELKEMGFEQGRRWNGQKENCYFLLLQGLTLVFWRDNTWGFGGIEMFPKDKAHLQSIILAFQPK